MKGAAESKSISWGCLYSSFSDKNRQPSMLDEDTQIERGEAKCERIISIDRSKYKSWTKSKPMGTKCNKYCGVHNPICWNRTEEYFKEALADLPKEGRPRKLTLEGLTHIRESISENNSRFA